MANVLLVVSDVEANRLLNRSSVQPAWPSLGVKFSSVPYDLTMDKDWYVRQTVPGEENWDQIIAVVAPGKRNPSEGASEDLGLKFQMQLRPPFNIHNGQSGQSFIFCCPLTVVGSFGCADILGTVLM